MNLKVVVIGGLFVGLLGPMSIGAYYSSTQQRQQLLADARDQHARATDVLALGVQKALWDLTPEGAVPLIQSVMQDTRIAQATVYDNQGSIFHEEAVADRRLGEILSLEKPVQNGDEVIGKVVVAFSMHQAEEAVRKELMQTLAISGVQAAVCIMILVALINARVLRRVQRIKSEANALARKKLAEPFLWEPTDEIGELGNALESTRQSLQSLFAELEAKNVELRDINLNLEDLVAQRTATIKMILDNVQSGFLLVDRNLNCLDGYTQSCVTLLGTDAITGRPLVELMRMDDRLRVHFQLCMDQVFEDFLPEEVSLGQVPQRFHLGDRAVSCAGTTIRGKDGAVEKVLFTIVDVSELERAEAENRANRALIRILQNMDSFREFVSESNDRLMHTMKAIKAGDESRLRRELHTLKGNAAAFGMDELAQLIHHVEDQQSITQKYIAQIEGEFARFLDEHFELLRIRLNEESEELIQIRQSLIQQLRESLSSEHPAPNLRRAVMSWLDEVQRVPAPSLLGPIAPYVQRLAEQLGKSVEFSIHGGEMRVDGGRFKPLFQNLIHLVRNSVDHGIETEMERGDKSPTASVSIEFSVEREHYLICVRDDGRGIDTSRLRAKAVERRLMSAKEADTIPDSQALDLVFADGVSTAVAVTDTSGRGVGMSSVKAAVDDLGGSISIQSVLGQGTTFVIRVPIVAQQETQKAA